MNAATFPAPLLWVLLLAVLALSVAELARRQREPDFEIRWLRRSLLGLLLAVVLLGSRVIVWIDQSDARMRASEHWIRSQTGMESAATTKPGGR